MDMGYGEKKMRKRSLISLIILVGVLIGILCGGSTPAQSYELTWWKISGGGGTSAAGSYTISGTIGQPEAGFLSGGIYTLAGGFWGMDFRSFIYLPLILRK
jgi:hypothetical protein